jgi:hypothetical protein
LPLFNIDHFAALICGARTTGGAVELLNVELVDTCRNGAEEQAHVDLVPGNDAGA